MSQPRTFVEPVRIAGVPTLVEPSRALPLVDVSLCFRGGVHDDPSTHAGLTRVVARAVRMGTAKRTAAAFEEAIAGLGGRLSADVGGRSVRFHGTVIARNLEPFLALVAGALAEPALRDADVRRVLREARAELISLRDDDRFLAGRVFREALFPDHPYGRPSVGTDATLRAIRTADVRARHAELVAPGRLVVGFAGDVDEATVRTLVERYLARFGGRAARVPAPAPTHAPRGLVVHVVDKPDRTQSQIILGGLGVRYGDPHHFPLQVGNVAFGGMFSGRLMTEVRVKRGYSYGASSRLGMDVRREAFVISTFPTLEHTVPCFELLHTLRARWVERGITPAELRGAKSCLVHGRCFDDDTPSKRLDAKLDLVLTGEPVSHYVDFDEKVSAVRRADVAAALEARIAPHDGVGVVVGPAKTLVPALGRVAGVDAIRVVSVRDVR